MIRRRVLVAGQRTNVRIEISSSKSTQGASGMAILLGNQEQHVTVAQVFEGLPVPTDAEFMEAESIRQLLDVLERREAFIS